MDFVGNVMNLEKILKVYREDEFRNIPPWSITVAGISKWYSEKPEYGQNIFVPLDCNLGPLNRLYVGFFKSAPEPMIICAQVFIFRELNNIEYEEVYDGDDGIKLLSNSGAFTPGSIGYIPLFRKFENQYKRVGI